LLAPFLPEAARGITARIGSPTHELEDLAHASVGLGKRFVPQLGAALFPRLGRVGALTEQAAVTARP
jgi:hypothetical protein